MLHLHGCLETAAQIYFIFLYRFCSLWYCFSKNKCCLYIWDSYFDRICSHSSCKLQMYKLHLYFYRVVMFYMCLVQRENWIKSIRNWCPQMQTHTHTHTQRFKKGQEISHPNFMSTDPLAWTPASTVTSKARATWAHQACIKQLAGGSHGASSLHDGSLSLAVWRGRLPSTLIYAKSALLIVFIFFFKQNPRSFPFWHNFYEDLKFYKRTEFCEKRPTSSWN